MCPAMPIRPISTHLTRYMTTNRKALTNVTGYVFGSPTLSSTASTVYIGSEDHSLYVTQSTSHNRTNNLNNCTGPGRRYRILDLVIYYGSVVSRPHTHPPKSSHAQPPLFVRRLHSHVTEQFTWVVKTPPCSCLLLPVGNFGFSFGDWSHHSRWFLFRVNVIFNSPASLSIC